MLPEKVGYYWYRIPQHPWHIVEVVREENVTPVLWVRSVGEELSEPLELYGGIFRGPIEAPDFCEKE